MGIKQNHPLVYAAAVLVITWIITGILFIKPSVGQGSFAIIMFIPAVAAIIFNKIHHNRVTCFKNKLNAKALKFGILYPILFILICGGIAQLLGRATPVAQEDWGVKLIITAIVSICINLFSALGEEYGWRGYLLPALTDRYGKVQATAIVGVIWALYHMPAVYLLAHHNGLAHPLLLCFIQAGAAFVFSFAFSYCYYLSGNLIPVLVFHSVWNVVNTTVLGDIYTNKPGVMDGNLVLINGEGVLGLVLGAVAMLFFIRSFQKAKRFGI